MKFSRKFLMAALPVVSVAALGALRYVRANDAAGKKISNSYDETKNNVKRMVRKAKRKAA